MPADHGLYHFLQWQSDQMTLVRPSPDWLSVSPFWYDLSKVGKRVIVLDLPLTFQPKPFNGVEISGWATHDRLSPPASFPTPMMDWVIREFGPSPTSEEVFEPQDPKSLLSLRDELIQATRRAAEVFKVLISRETWDLFMCAFGATHLGGHRLWDLTGTLGFVEPGDRAEFSHALQDVYVECDKAVGQLVKTAGDGVTIVVFSLHGMGPNTSRAAVLPQMLERIMTGKERSLTDSGRQVHLERLLNLIPLEWRRGIKRRLPLSFQQRLTTYWRMGKVNWTVTQAFSMVADLQGYIRVNMSGREAAGIVQPGEECDRLCAEIIDGLGTFIDADTGEPVVESVIRIDQLFTQGTRRDYLPDMLVRWTNSPSANHREIVSSRYGSIPWPIPGRNPDGRSGNHRPEGFFLAVGDRITPDSREKIAHILDLAPTVYALLDLSKPNEMCGNALF